MATDYYRVGLILILLRASETLAAPLISTVALLASTHLLEVDFTRPYTLLAIFSAFLCYMFVRPETKQHRFVFPSGWTIATRTVLAWFAVAGILLLIGYATKVSELYSRRALFAWVIVTPILLIATHAVLRKGLRGIAVASGNARRVVFVGLNGVSRQLARIIAERPELGLETKGFFEDRCPHRLHVDDSKVMLGTLAELPEYTNRHRIDVIFVAMPHHLERTRALLHRLRDTTASVYLIPEISFIDLIQSRIDEISGIPVIALCETPLHGWSGLGKRSADVVLALLMLLIALPLMALIAVGIKLTMPGSIIFKQRRYGLDGEQIIVYKFRTMTVSEDGAQVRQATRNDPRVTGFGLFLRHYSLDELPQLFNVLQGRMSLVGPRPHAVAHNEEYRKLIDGYMVRHKVSPGLTGLAQVNGCRGETSNLAEMKRRVAYDLDYLRHWSFMLDLQILCKTMKILLKGEKAY